MPRAPAREVARTVSGLGRLPQLARHDRGDRALNDDTIGL